MTLLNAGDVDADWGVAIDAYGSATGVKFTTSVTSVSIPAGGTATFTVKAAFSKKAVKGDKQAWLVITDGTDLVAHAAVYAFVK